MLHYGAVYWTVAKRKEDLMIAGGDKDVELDSRSDWTRSGARSSEKDAGY